MESGGQGRNGVDAASGGPAEIMVVDDEVVVQTLVKEVLSSEGYDVTTAGDGEEAVELMNRKEFDLIITDVVMPGVNGVHVLRAAKRADPNYPVIMITGFPSADTVKKMIKLGAADYIVKPFNMDLIKVTVAKVLEMKRQLDLASRKGSAEQIPGIDSITGAYNVRAFVDLLEAEIGRSDWRGHICSLLAIGIDRLHVRVAKEGQLLKQFVRLLRHLARPGDIIGRMDQAEFALILPETGHEDAQELGEQVRRKAEWTFTISTGVACFPRDASDAGSLLDKARAARQGAGGTGR